MRPVHKKALHQQARGRHRGIMCPPPQDRARRLPALHAEHRGRAGRRRADAGRRAVDAARARQGVHERRAVLPAARLRAPSARTIPSRTRTTSGRCTGRGLCTRNRQSATRRSRRPWRRLGGGTPCVSIGRPRATGRTPRVLVAATSHDHLRNSPSTRRRDRRIVVRKPLRSAEDRSLSLRSRTRTTAARIPVRSRSMRVCASAWALGRARPPRLLFGRTGRGGGVGSVGAPGEGGGGGRFIMPSTLSRNSATDRPSAICPAFSIASSIGLKSRSTLALFAAASFGDRRALASQPRATSPRSLRIL